ncbi:MAG: PilZ domain-containing protein [Proteobacteria bacterium]|nr:PilZ domain-containing protein [Pseudomonadota bacterium]
MAEEQGAAGTDPRNRRAYPRYEITAYVDYTGTSEVLLYHRIENISLGGMSIQTASVEELGTIVEVVISFPELNTTIAARGEVSWVNREEPMDMGIRFLELDEERKDVLRRFIQSTKKGGPL